MARTLAIILIGFIIASCSIVDSSRHYEVEMQSNLEHIVYGNYEVMMAHFLVKNTGFRSQWVHWDYNSSSIIAYDRLIDGEWVRTPYNPITRGLLGSQEIRSGESFYTTIPLHYDGTYRVVILTFKKEQISDATKDGVTFTSDSFEVVFPVQTTDSVSSWSAPIQSL